MKLGLVANSKEQTKKAPNWSSGPLEFIPAATYVPTEVPVQDHRPGGA
jgi:hypothetical protein